MSTLRIINFSLFEAKGLPLVAATPSARIPLPNQELPDIMIVNEGAVTVFVNTGDSTVTANATNMPILAGEKGVYSRGLREKPITHIAAFVVSGTQAITVIQGSGS